MNRKTAVVLAGALAVSSAMFSLPIHSASSAPLEKKKTTCKYVTKTVHGKRQKVKVCHSSTVKPKPTSTPKPTATPTASPTNTPTPTPTATVTPIPATVSVSLAAPPPGYSLTQSNGTFELTNTSNGARVDLSQFTVTTDNFNGRNYVVNMYVKATKIPSPADADSPSWYPDTSMFGLVASNQHPYSFFDSCSSTPSFGGKAVYNGETTEGWMCSDDIAAQNAPGTYTLRWDAGNYSSVPVLSLVLTTPSQ